MVYLFYRATPFYRLSIAERVILHRARVFAIIKKLARARALILLRLKAQRFAKGTRDCLGGDGDVSGLVKREEQMEIICRSTSEGRRRSSSSSSRNRAKRPDATGILIVPPPCINGLPRYRSEVTPAIATVT